MNPEEVNTQLPDQAPPLVQPDMTPDEAAAALAMITKLSEDYMIAQNPQQSPEMAQGEEMGGEAGNVPAEEPVEEKAPEIDIETKIEEAVSKAMDKKMSGLRDELMEMLDDEEGED